jgi:hypothetical protein
MLGTLVTPAAVNDDARQWKVHVRTVPRVACRLLSIPSEPSTAGRPRSAKVPGCSEVRVIADGHSLPRAPSAAACPPGAAWIAPAARHAPTPPGTLDPRPRVDRRAPAEVQAKAVNSCSTDRLCAIVAGALASGRDRLAGLRVHRPGRIATFPAPLPLDSTPTAVNSSFAGQPGARAAELQSAFDEAAESGVPVGAVLSEFSRVHGGSIEGC